MDWWQTVGMMGTFVATATAVASLGWRMLEKMRQESREAHEKIGSTIVAVRDGLDAKSDTLRDGLEARITGLDAKIDTFRDGLDAGITTVRDDLGAAIAKGNESLIGVREGLAGVRGELRGVTSALGTLREDFRAHVYGKE